MSVRDLKNHAGEMSVCDLKNHAWEISLTRIITQEKCMSVT